jgi:hypothetical protein
MEFLLIRNGVLHRGGILFYIIPLWLYNMMKVIPETRRAHYIYIYVYIYIYIIYVWKLNQTVLELYF